MRLLTALLLFAAGAFAQLSKINYPTDYSTVTSGTRANLKANFDEIKTKDDPAKDSIDEVRGRMSGYSGDYTLTSLDNLRLRLDVDGSGVGRFVVVNGATGDSVFRASEDSTWRFWGAGVGTKLTLSDSILAATAQISGNGYFGGTLTAAGATSLAGLSATTGAFSSNVTVGGTMGVTGVATLSGSTTLSGSLTLSTLSSGRIPVVSTAGLITQDNLYWDATNDRLGIGDGAGTPAGKLDLRTASVGGIVQGIAYNSDNTNTGSHARWQVTSGGAAGGDAYFQASINGVIDWAMGIDNSDNDAWVLSEASTLGTSNRLRISSTQLRAYGNLQVDGTSTLTGAATFTAAPTFSSVTASEFLLTDGSKALTSVAGTGSGSVVRATSPTLASPTFSGTITTPLTASLPVFTSGSSQLTTNAVTGTGNVMMSASPTTTGTLTGAAANFSGAVSTAGLTATTLTTQGGEAFTYGDTSFTMTANGISGSPTGTAYATRIGSIVVMRIPCFAGTSTSTSFTLTGMPSSWYTSSAGITQTVSIGHVTNNGTAEAGGTITIGDGSTAFTVNRGAWANWTASGTKSINGAGSCAIVADGPTITYQLQ